MPVSWTLVRELLASELGAPVDEVFTQFEGQPLAAATGIMAVVLLASQGGPLLSQGVRLYAVFGSNLLVISAVLAIRVLSAQARWRRGPKDGSGWRRADR